MIIPVRCFSCGKPISGLYEEFKQRVENGEDASKVLDSLGVKRYCCRKMLMTHANVIDDVMQYEK